MFAQAQYTPPPDPNAEAKLAAARLHMARHGCDLLTALLFLEEREREALGPPIIDGMRADSSSLAQFNAARARQERTGEAFVAAALAVEAGADERELATVTLRSTSTGERIVMLRAPSTAAPTGFKGLAYSGGPVRSGGGTMAIDLAGLDMKAEVPVLLNHDSNKIVGRAKLHNSGIELRILEGRFSQVTEHGRQAAALMGEGHPWDLSVGMGGVFESRDAKKPVTLNGRTLHVDTILRRARLLELSFVPAGADPKATASQHD
jgi:hypothetical protein